MASRPDTPRLILASGSITRRDMMRAAGLEFDVIAANVDEAAIRESLLGGDADVEPEDVAEILARTKAEAVSAANPGALVIGADQILALGSEIINKSKSLGEAKTTLLKLAGNRHHLHSAVALAENGRVTWAHVETALLLMRKLTPEAAASYLARAGDDVLGSVGCYKIEGLGIQLFEDFAGDHFTILGLPLLPLLAELRRRGALAA